MARGVSGWLAGHVAPPRFIAFAVVSLATGLIAAGFFGFKLADATTIGFDVGALVFLASMVPLLREHDAEDIRRHARENDAGRMLVLGLTGAVVMVVLTALAGELPNAAKGETGAIVRLLGTLMLAWLFANTVFATHYAHLYYSRKGGGGDCGGLDFSGEETPDYGDFLYFAITLGMTFQTSDTAVSTRKMRQVVLIHSFAAFVFNLGVLAFVINGLAGLAG